MEMRFGQFKSALEADPVNRDAEVQDEIGFVFAHINDAEESLLRVIDEWKTLDVGGWMDGKIPWFRFAEEMGVRAGKMFGAGKDEVIFTGTTTVNIHTLAGSFYKHEGRRTNILADELNFPSDLYALQGLLKLRNFDPADNLILVKPYRH